jgi:hypothetical protein
MPAERLLKCGDTLHISKRQTKKGQDETPHLWIIITDADPNTDEIVMVNLTTHREGSDATVVLKKGDHPYIIHDSVVFFHDAKIVQISDLEQLMISYPNLCRKCDKCSNSVLKRIQAGLLKSEFTHKKVIAFCRKAWNL